MENDGAFAEVLNNCLDAIEAGQASIEECLAHYPQHADQLEDLLRLSDQARRVPPHAPTPEMLAAGERQLLQAVQSRVEERHAHQKDTDLLSVLSRRLVEPAKAKLRSGSKWPVPVVALSAAAALLTCVLLAVIGGGATWWATRDQGHPVDPASTTAPAVAIERDLPPLITPTPAIRSEGAVDQGVSPLPSPTHEAAAVQDPTPDADRVHTVFLPSLISPLPPHRAILTGLRGLVEVQAGADTWTRASARQIVDIGQRVRTGALSAGHIVFYDGSTAFLGPDTELSIDALGQDADGRSRIVELTQWVGETDHDVAPARGDNARYEVHTPSGTGEAKGTLFHVLVTPALFTHFRVDEGAVAVTHLDVTVIVVAGQMTTIDFGKPPHEPFFRVTGEGEVEANGPTWQIAGQTFETHDATVIVGNPQVGDWVHVEGHLLADGTRVADRIVLLHRSPVDRFTIIGEVEATGTVTWTVAGQEIAIDDETEIDEGIQVDHLVHVEGVIGDGGMLLARSIRLIDDGGSPFGFVGVTQEITDTYWVVSGISVTVDAKTVIDDGLAVGDVVRVRGQRTSDGRWLARSIRRLQPQVRTFEFVGLVEDTDPWVVSGIELETRMWTEIQDEIEAGDLVKVEGRILPDGTWLAEEIKLVDDDQDLIFEFAGTVEDTKPWVVSGITLTVDYRTEIQGEIEIGDLVKVEGEILSNGEWLAQEIKLAAPRWGKGCTQLTALIIRIEDGQVVLEDGTIIPLDGVYIDGDLHADSVIVIQVCVDEDGNVTVVSIVVIYHKPPAIVVPPTPKPSSPPPAPPAGSSPIVVSDNNKTQTFTCNGQSVTINGNDNTITLLGSCGPVTVRGNSNSVSIQSATSVTDTGNNNTIVGP